VVVAKINTVMEGVVMEQIAGEEIT
jgi:hypothetical protein